MIEDWLAQRELVDHVRNDVEGYEKVLDLFCLHVLPRLHDWEYARDFLEYESVLASTTRTVRLLLNFLCRFPDMIGVAVANNTRRLAT